MVRMNSRRTIRPKRIERSREIYKAIAADAAACGMTPKQFAGRARFYCPERRTPQLRAGDARSGDGKNPPSFGETLCASGGGPTQESPKDRRSGSTHLEPQPWKPLLRLEP